VKSSIIKDINEEFQFSICNPPFFESAENKTDGFGGTEAEMCVDGGEFKFIKQYIVESWSKRAKNRFFSTLIGIKSHLKTITSFLEKNFPSSEVQSTTLYQGKTLRWAIAWKFTAYN
jgi:23S rRNA A1618 N6-methylase RlmF